jgi:hypothetical protein
MKTPIHPSILRCAMVVAALITGNAHAGYISGVTATTNIPIGTGDISHMTDGSGLSALSFSANHAPASAGNVWRGTGTSGSIDFNLHGLYNLDTLAVWNIKGAYTRGVKDLTLFTSLDGLNYSPLTGAPTRFAIPPFVAGLKAEQFSFAPTTAAYVRFNITSNWGDAAIGLSEIAFGGTPASTSVPEPSALALFGIAATALFARRRRVV